MEEGGGENLAHDTQRKHTIKRYKIFSLNYNNAFAINSLAKSLKKYIHLYLLTMPFIVIAIENESMMKPLFEILQHGLAFVFIDIKLPKL